MERVRVLLVDDSDDFLDCVQQCLVQHPGVRVVGSARSGEEALRALGAARPDLVVLDIAMPGMGGLAAARAIKETLPESRVVILTANDTEVYRSVSRRVADAFVAKTEFLATLVPLIETMFPAPRR